MPKIGNKKPLRISLDTETTGLDLRHGAKPFLVTTCDESGMVRYWEWDVDPLTRQPKIPKSDIEEIRERIEEAETIAMQNGKFDVLSLRQIGITDFPWEKVVDTLIVGHMLASNQPHDLTTMALVYLGVNIAQYEDELTEACKEARRIAKSKYPNWRIAKEGLPEMPSAKEKTHKFDMWLPRAIARAEGYLPSHPWHTLCAEYANMDSQVTLPLADAMMEEVHERKLESILKLRHKILPVVSSMEIVGLTVNGDHVEELEEHYKEDAEISGRVCVNIAKSYGYELQLPKSGVNNSLKDFLYNGLELEEQLNKKTKQPTLDKGAMQHYLDTLPPRSKPLKFIERLMSKRQRETALSYMEGYRRFWRPEPECENFFRLFPFLNPTGTDTLRFSSQNPNSQNFSKTIFEEGGKSLRYCLGPKPGRIWYSADAENIELRLPAYEADEKAMIELFERPNDPPYFGSNHSLVCHILYPKEFDQCLKDGVTFKDRYKATLYQWVKNGNFAIQYGAQEQSGTADRAYHYPGAQRIIQKRLGKINELNQYWIEFANEKGYVETIPDSSVDPERGYPLLCTRSNWGKILPTVPLSYHVQGSAMWWMTKAMIRVHEYLESLNRKYGYSHGEGYYIIAQIHDELVFDFPKYFKANGEDLNLPIIKRCKELMEEGGKDYGIPTPVSVETHENNYGEGVKIKWK